jgi:DNA invertase Pin-like site-specific DNA recombinase
MIYPKELKGFTPHAYIRISTDEQSPADKEKPLDKRENMKKQLKVIKKWLSQNNLPPLKPENIHYELASGGDPTRPVLQRAITQAVNGKGKRMFMVAELSRFSRDLRHGMQATIPLYENGVPLVVTDDGLITGTKQRPEGDNDILMGLKISLATGERERLRKRVQKSIEASKEAGVFTSKGLELYPDSKNDLYQWFIDNLAKIAPKKKGGIGNTEVMKQLSVVYGNTVPFSIGTVQRAYERLMEMKGEMTPEEFDNWNTFRKRILAMEQMFGQNDWRMKAVRYRTNGYITKPLDPAYSVQPSEEVIQEAIDNPSENISFKQFKQYRKEVSKRGSN